MATVGFARRHHQNGRLAFARGTPRSGYPAGPLVREYWLQGWDEASNEASALSTISLADLPSQGPTPEDVRDKIANILSWDIPRERANEVSEAIVKLIEVMLAKSGAGCVRDF